MEPLVSIIMGSDSDWEVMAECAKTLDELQVPYQVQVVSAHRTPDLLFEHALRCEKDGIEVIVAGAGGAAHLPGMTAAKTVLPVLGVPIDSTRLQGLDSLLSIVQMPAGVPVGTLAIGKAGARNAAFLAAAIISNKHPRYREILRVFRQKQADKVLAIGDPRSGSKASVSPYARREPRGRDMSLQPKLKSKVEPKGPGAKGGGKSGKKLKR